MQKDSTFAYALSEWRQSIGQKVAATESNSNPYSLFPNTYYLLPKLSPEHNGH